MTPVEALHELRRMAAPTCWRCQGRGWTYVRDLARRTMDYGVCPSCNGTGQPERAA